MIPIYKSSGTIHDLFGELLKLSPEISDQLEVIFVNDSSPDDSVFRLRQLAVSQSFKVRIIHHSRNFGAFNAIRSGLDQSSGEFLAVMAADLQEPIELIQQFFEVLATKEFDLVVGKRVNRQDPFVSRTLSRIFWALYRTLISKDVPAGGVDVFGLSKRFKDELMQLKESRSSLIAQLFWLGFRRREIPYKRQKRFEGRSSWTFSKKFDYLLDSVFAFTDLPIKFLLFSGAFGLVLSGFLGALVLLAKMSGSTTTPGFAATFITILFFGSLNMVGLGLVGNYSWRGYENSKNRPGSLIMFSEEFNEHEG